MIGTPEIIILLILPIFFFVFIWFLIKGFFRQQQQQQVVVHGETQKKRICPKCSWQNDMDNKFCGNCGYKFGNR